MDRSVGMERYSWNGWRAFFFGGEGIMWVILSNTLQETNISRFQGTFEDDFPFPQVGYVNSLEGICFWTYLIDVILTIGFQSNHWTPFYCINGMSQGVSSSCWTIFEVDEHVPSYTMLYTHSKPVCFTGIYCGYNYLRTRMGPVERRIILLPCEAYSGISTIGPYLLLITAKL